MKNNTLIFLFTTFFIFGLAGIVEVTLKKSAADNASWPYPREVSRPIEENDLLLYGNKKNEKIFFTFSDNPQIQHPQNFYSLNQWGMRYSPTPNHSQKHNKFLAMFGCSMIFGQGVRDEETLPHLLSEKLSEFRPYNFGVNGYGVQQMLALLESGQAKKVITENQGVVIYTYITDHLNRLFASHGTLPWHPAAPPHYDTDAVGDIHLRPNFRPADISFFNQFIQFLADLQILKSLHLSFPKFFKRDYDLFCKMLTKSRDLVKKDFPHSSSFYVFFHPMGTRPDSELDRPIKTCLKQNNIPILDQESLQITQLEWEKLNQEPLLNVDHLHPSAAGNSYLSILLASYLKKSWPRGLGLK